MQHGINVASKFAGLLAIGAALSCPAVGLAAEPPPCDCVPTSFKGNVPRPWREPIGQRFEATLTRGGIAHGRTDAFNLELSVTARDRDYSLRVEIRDEAKGESVATLSDRCDTCGWNELVQTVDDLAVKTRRQLRSLKKRREAPPPPKPRPPEPAPQPAPPKRPLRALAGVTLGLGVGALVSGVALLALHGRPIKRACDGDDVDADGDCRFLYRTLPAGAVLTAVGSAAIAGGIAMALRSRRGRRRERAALALGPSGLEVAF